MPYNPGVSYDTSGLAGGIAQAGQAIAQGLNTMAQNRQKMDALELSAHLLAQQHPEVIDPATLEKFSKGGLGQREALVGQMTAAVAEKYRNSALQLGAERINVDRERLAEDSRQFNTRENNDILSAVPKFLPQPQGGVQGFVPKTGQIIPAPKATLPEPESKWETHNGPDGKPASKSRWNPYTGKTETIPLRSGPVDPWAAAGLPTGGATTGQPQGNGPAALMQPGAAPAAAAPKYAPGQIYKDASGNRARYNQDGTWTPVK